MKSMIKPTILSLSLLTVMAGAAVAPAIAQIATAFPETSESAIKLVVTMPAIFMIVFTLISGQLSSKISARSILVIGLLFYLVGGLGSAFVGSFSMLLLSRAVLGIGVGLIMPLSTGLIADFFDGKERAKMLGYSVSATQLGGIICSIAAGALATLNWRYTFAVYSMGLIVFVLILLFLPEPPEIKGAVTYKQKLPKSVYAWASGAFALMVAFYAIPVNIAIFMQNNHLGDSSLSGIALAVLTACGFIAGLFYVKVRLFLKSFLLIVLFGMMAVGFLLLSQAASVSQILIAISIVGFGLGWTMPTLYSGASHAGGKGAGVRVMAIVSCMLFLGQFLSPIILDALGQLLGNTSTRFSFTIVAFCSGSLCLVTLILRTITQWKRGAAEDKVEFIE
ncbi:MFS transporter [Vibrio sp. WJH972]